METDGVPSAPEPASAMVARLMVESLAASLSAGYLRIMFTVGLARVGVGTAGAGPSGAAGGAVAGAMAGAAGGAVAGTAGAAPPDPITAEGRQLSLRRFGIVGDIATAKITAAQDNDAFVGVSADVFGKRVQRKCKEGLVKQNLSYALSDAERAEISRLVKEMVRHGTNPGSGFKERDGPEAAAGYSPKKGGKQLGFTQQPFKSSGRGRGRGCGGDGGQRGGRGGGRCGGRGGGGSAGAGAAPAKAQ